MARAMVQMEEAMKEPSAALVAAKEGTGSAKSGAKKGGCFECGKNHLVRRCPEVRNGIGQLTGRRWNFGGQRQTQRPGPHCDGAGGPEDRGQQQCMCYPHRSAALAIEDSTSGNDFGLSSAQASARYQ